MRNFCPTGHTCASYNTKRELIEMRNREINFSRLLAQLETYKIDSTKSRLHIISTYNTQKNHKLITCDSEKIHSMTSINSEKTKHKMISGSSSMNLTPEFNSNPSYKEATRLSKLGSHLKSSYRELKTRQERKSAILALIEKLKGGSHLVAH